MTGLQRIAVLLEQELRCRMDQSGLMYRLFFRVKTERSIRHKMTIKGDAYRAGKMLMQDIIGFRIVLYFQDDVDIVSLFLSRNGLVRKSVDEPDTFTFRPQRLNLTLAIPEEQVEAFRAELPEEYAPYIGSTYEVQIRTIFSEGWHEVEHDLRYKCKEDWEGYETYSRVLNGLIGTLETAEWSMKSLFADLADKNFKMGNYRAMFRNKLHLRLRNDDFSPQVTDFLERHPEVAKVVLEMDRVMLVFALMNRERPLPLTFDNLLFLINRFELLNPELRELEDEAFREQFGELTAD